MNMLLPNLRLDHANILDAQAVSAQSFFLKSVLKYLSINYKSFEGNMFYLL